MLGKVKEIFQDNTLCVLCTASGGIPHCSLMTYVLGDDLKTVYEQKGRFLLLSTFPTGAATRGGYFVHTLTSI